MAFNLTYVPFNSSHLRQTLPVLCALRREGAIVRILCLDAMQVEAHQVLAQIQSTDFGHDDLPGGTYRPHLHWLACALQRGSLVRAFESYLDNDHTSLYLFSDDTLVPTRLLARSLVRRGVPYVLIADGIQSPLKAAYRAPLRDSLSRFARRRLYGWGPRGTGGASRVLVMTRTCGNVLRDHGIATERIFVVGSPAYDQLAASRRVVDENLAVRAIRRRLDLALDRPIIFYAHQQITRRDLTESVVWNLAEGCRRIGASLLVKFHPHASEDPGLWRVLARDRRLDPNIVSFFKTECSSIEAVQVCTVCVTAFSTVSLEAMIHRRPVIVLQYLPVPETLTFARDYAAALDVDTSEGIPEAIRQSVEDSRVRERLVANGLEVLRQELHGLDGRSLRRTVDAILGLVPRP